MIVKISFWTLVSRNESGMDFQKLGLLIAAIILVPVIDASSQCLESGALCDPYGPVEVDCCDYLVCEEEIDSDGLGAYVCNDD